MPRILIQPKGPILTQSLGKTVSLRALELVEEIARTVNLQAAATNLRRSTPAASQQLKKSCKRRWAKPCLITGSGRAAGAGWAISTPLGGLRARQFQGQTRWAKFDVFEEPVSFFEIWIVFFKIFHHWLHLWLTR